MGAQQDSPLRGRICSVECSDATGLNKLPWELWASLSASQGAALLKWSSPTAASSALTSSLLPCFSVCILTVTFTGVLILFGIVLLPFMCCTSGQADREGPMSISEQGAVPFLCAQGSLQCVSGVVVLWRKSDATKV